MSLAFILGLAALICFGLAAFNVPTSRIALVPLGLALLVCATLFAGAGRVV